MKMELIGGSETSAIRTQTPRNYPKENILHIEYGERLKSRKYTIFVAHCMNVCIYLCMYTYLFVSVNVCMYTCMHVCMYVCIYICVCVCVCILWHTEGGLGGSTPPP